MESYSKFVIIELILEAKWDCTKLNLVCKAVCLNVYF